MLQLWRSACTSLRMRQKFPHFTSSTVFFTSSLVAHHSRLAFSLTYPGCAFLHWHITGSSGTMVGGRIRSGVICGFGFYDGMAHTYRPLSPRLLFLTLVVIGCVLRTPNILGISILSHHQHYCWNLYCFSKAFPCVNL